MKNLLIILLMFFSITSQAKVLSETSQEMEIEISEDNLTCKMTETWAHNGVLTFPTSLLSAELPLETLFVHEYFVGSLDLHTTEECDATDQLIKESQGKVNAKVTVVVMEWVFQDKKDGPIREIQTIEKVRIELLDGTERYLESSHTETETF